MACDFSLDTEVKVPKHSVPTPVLQTKMIALKYLPVYVLYSNEIKEWEVKGRTGFCQDKIKNWNYTNEF